METIGSQMAALRAEAGVSLAKVAKAGGWGGASSVQKYFEPDYAMPLRADVAERFARSLGPGVFEIAKVEAQNVYTSLSDVIALLRNKSIPADVRCAAAAEKLSEMAR